VKKYSCGYSGAYCPLPGKPGLTGMF